MPSPRSVITSPGCVPGGSSTEAVPSSVATSQRASERRQRSGDVQRRDQIVAFAHEALVVAHAHQHVQVARGRARLAGVSAAGEPDALTVRDAGRHVHLERAPPVHAPTCRGTLVHGCAAHAPVAVAGVAGHRAHHLPEGRARDRLQLSGAAAALARLDRRSRLGAVAVTVLAALDRLEADLHASPVGRLEQLDLDRDGDVTRPGPARARRRTRPRRRRTR